jgi:peptide deformylase
MVIRETLLIGNPQLREVSDPIYDYERELQPILEDLKDTLTEHQRVYKMGRGIAAPQIGYKKQVVYIQTDDFTGYLINPSIVYRSPETFEVWDSCFSLDAAFFVKIERNKRIKVKYTDQFGEFHNDTFTGDMAELLQHEIDHLDGVMCSDHLTDPKNIALRAEWEKRYRVPGVGM